MTRTSWLSPDPAQRFTEVHVLLYAPVWMLVLVLVTWSGALTRIGDPGHLLIGFGLALPLWLLPVLRPAPGERRLPLTRRYGVKALAFITLLSFLQNYFGAVLFFRCLGMQYHFRVSLLLNGTPLFLYPLTVAYFATYFVALQIALRGLAGLLALPGPARLALRAALSYGVAFAETFFMANQALRSFFSYADRGFALRVGSLAYGTLFLISAPLYDRIADRRAPPLSQVLWWVLGANTLIMVCYEGFMRLVLSCPFPAP